MYATNIQRESGATEVRRDFGDRYDYGAMKNAGMIHSWKIPSGKVRVQVCVTLRICNFSLQNS